MSEFEVACLEHLRKHAPWSGFNCQTCGNALIERDSCWQHRGFSVYFHVTCVDRAECLKNLDRFQFHTGLSSLFIAESRAKIAQSMGLRYRFELHCYPLGEMLCDQEYRVDLFQ